MSEESGGRVGRLRLATLADLGGLEALAKACVADMRRSGIEQWNEIYPDAAVFARDIGAGALWVFIEAGEGGEEGGVKGAFAVDRRFDPQWAGLAWSMPDAGAAAVHRVMVHPEWRGRGLAGMLMARAEALARAGGAHSLRLDAFAANPAALRVYEKLGYRKTGEVVFRKGLFFGLEKVF